MSHRKQDQVIHEMAFTLIQWRMNMNSPFSDKERQAMQQRMLQAHRDRIANGDLQPSDHIIEMRKRDKQFRQEANQAYWNKMLTT